MRNMHYAYIFGFCLLFIIANSILYLEELPTIRMIVSLLRICAVLFSFFWAIKDKNFGGKFMWWVLGFFFILISITIVKHGALNMVLSYFINSVGITLLIYSALKQSPKMAIQVAADVFALYIYINLLTLIIAPDGLFNGSYLIGRNYNQIGMTLVCGMITNVVAYNMGVKKLIPVLVLCVVALMSPIITGSMTSVVGCLLTIIYLFIKKQHKKTILIAFLSFYILFQVFVVFMQSDVSNIQLVTYIVEELMGKELTFSQRARVWLIAFDMIGDSPIVGYGFRGPDWFEDYFIVKSAHNILFQMMLYGGVIIVAYLLFMIVSSIRHALKKIDTHTYTLLFGVCTIFFMMMMESYSMVLLLYILCVTYNSYTFQKISIVASSNTLHNTNKKC